MLRRFIFLNLLFALVFLPVAQANMFSLDPTSTPDTEHQHMADCEKMQHANCQQNPDCLVSGMQCVDYNIVGLLFVEDLSFEQSENASMVKITTHYYYLSPRSILRPPRLI